MAQDGSLINYELYGTGNGSDTVLLLHGLLGSMRSHWSKFVTPLSANFQVLQVDLRGHGESENVAMTLDLDMMLQDIEGLLNSLQIESVHAAGYDFGGYLGLMLHLDQPESVKSLMMHSTKFYWPDYTINRMLKNLNPDLMSEKVPGYAGQLLTEHGAGRWRSLVRQAGDLIANISSSKMTESMARQASCPVLVSVGDRDEMIPVEEALRLSCLMQNGALLVLPGVSHSFHVTSTQALLGPMMAFLNLNGTPWLSRPS
ncbi:MAG: alpha/beta fold hydrolase [Candidatus Promineifilaceae bacterium]